MTATLFGMSENKFHIGQIVHHKRFHYRGVIAWVDPCFKLSEEWYDNMATTKPPKNKPWYHVLVDHAVHTTYVSEQDLETAEDNHQITHPLLGEYFDRYTGQKYLTKTSVNR